MDPKRYETWLDEVVATNPVPPALVLPLRYATAEFEALPEGAVRDVTRRYLLEFYDAAPAGHAPLFLGAAREWKTYAAAVIARAAAAVGVETVFVSVPDEMLRLETQRFTAATQATLDRWMRVPLLVLDDAFRPEPGSWAMNTLIAVFGARFNALRPTLLTGNLALPADVPVFEAVGLRYGPLFARRLEDASVGFRVLI